MPIYSYKCDSCGFAKDVLQKLSDAPLSQCPSCGFSSFTKQLTAAGFQLKGSGWYATDFKGGNNGASSGDEKAPAGGDAKSDIKNDAKTDVKADAKADVKGDRRTETKGESKTESKSPSKPADGGPVVKKPAAPPAAGSGA